MITAAENNTRYLLRWALDNTPLRVPPKLQRHAAWCWLEADQQLAATYRKTRWRYHTELTVRGRIKTRHAVLTLHDIADRTVRWESDIPPAVYAAATDR